MSMRIHGSGKGQACPSATVQTLGYKYVSFNGGYRVLQVRNTSSTGSLLSAESGTKYNIEPYTQIYIWMEGPTGNSNYTQWFDASLTFTNA